MSLPFFFIDNEYAETNILTLSEEASRHIVQVLRMKEGEFLQLTNGKGLLLKSVLKKAHKKHAVVSVLEQEQQAPPKQEVIMAVSLLKNTARLEWFLEKAAELGVSKIIPLRCERTEKMQFRTDRAKQILISAMLQSRQCFLTQISEPQNYAAYIQSLKGADFDSKWIAHCMPEEKPLLKNAIQPAYKKTVLLIGPEGDFSENEIILAKENGFTSVSLGNTRLRTETADLTGSVILCMHKIS
ncbi:MAG: RsmE family RNA methyltransferase [Bacteroidota bacterium]